MYVKCATCKKVMTGVLSPDVRKFCAKCSKAKKCNCAICRSKSHKQKGSSNAT